MTSIDKECNCIYNKKNELVYKCIYHKYYKEE